MNKRPFVFAVVSFVLGVLCSAYGIWVIIAAALPILAAFYEQYKHREQTKKIIVMALVMSAFFAAGMWRMQTETDSRSNVLSILTDGKEVCLWGEICKKEEKEEKVQVCLRSVRLQTENQIYHTNQVLTYLDTDEYPIGTTLILKGNIQRFHRAGNEGAFDEENYYQNRKIDYRLNQKEVLGCYGKENKISEKLYDLKKRLRKSFAENTDSKSAGILSVMILGEKSLLDEEVKELYRKMGISHILAISGLHISLIGMGLYRLLRKFGRSIYSSSLCSVLLLLFYVDLTDGSASMIRAVIMFFVLSGARCIGRTYDPMTALALAVFLLLFENPFLHADLGFLFSVSAILGVIFAGKYASSWSVCVMIQLMTLPLAAYSYFEVFLPAIFLNLFLLPLVPAVVFFGIAGGILGVFWNTAGRVILWIPRIMLTIFEVTGKFAVSVPWGTYVIGQPKIIQIFFYYLLLVLWIIRRRKKDMRSEKEKRIEREARKDRAKFFALVSLQSAKETAIVVFVLCLMLSFRPRKYTKIDILDVGQGDGICIQEKGGTNIFIDGGSSSEMSIGTYGILPYLKSNGMASVDYWFVSHADADHVNGLIQVLESGYSVRCLIFSSGCIINENMETVTELAKERGCEILSMCAGDRLNMKSGSIFCVFPDEQYRSTDINAKSMVLLYEENGFEALFTGDIGKEQEAYIMQKKKIAAVDFYKASHHGSKNANDREWLLALQPSISVVSCAKKNRYGHPGKEAVENMENAGSYIFYTMDGGQVSVRIRKEYLEITNFRNPLEVYRCIVVE